MKYAVEMGSGAMMYIPNFIKISSDVHKLEMGDLHMQRYTQAVR
jgi:hypothetical protein